VSMKSHYADKAQEDLNLPLNIHVAFNLKNTATVPVPEAVATSPYSKDNTRYFVKVMLFSGPGPEDDKTKGKVHLTKRLNFLLVRKEHGGVAPIGGEWSAAKDGAKPDDAALKKTAIRVTKELVGIDLSKCTEWLKFVEFAYKKEDGSLTSTVFFVPNIWDHFPEGLEPATQVKEETKQVKELVEEEVEDPEDAEKKKTVKKEVTVDKVVQVVQWRPYEISLHSLLEFDCTRPTTDDIVEFCLFADCFHEMLQRDFGIQVIDILKQKKIEAVENDKKRKREEEAAAEKKAKLENGEAKEEKKEEPAKPKTKLQHTVNQEILAPFQFFDRQPHTGMIAGSLRRDVLEGVMHQYGTMTKREIDDLLQKGAGLQPSTAAYGPPAILYYVKLATTTTEVPVEEEKPEPVTEVSKEEAKADDTPVEEAEAAGDEAQAADGPMTEASLNKLLLKDLRTMCQDKGFSIQGKKAELIEAERHSKEASCLTANVGFLPELSPTLIRTAKRCMNALVAVCSERSERNWRTLRTNIALERGVRVSKLPRYRWRCAWTCT